ncbi:hypothetical protein [Streptomyces sp. NPDC005244]|uniref:hypothetical protein n=1 Tax=Streptomyces sp. NPDC005244 TaxID=3364708 RepID=UPI0036C92DF2
MAVTVVPLSWLDPEFPEIATAARDLPPVILDGEIVIWHDGRLAFQRLRHRLNRHPGLGRS